MTYDDYLSRLMARVKSHDGAMFNTSVPKGALYAVYLGSFLTPEEKQYHTCNSCQHFIGRYGSMVTIDANGVAKSLMWDEVDNPPEAYRPGIIVMKGLVESAAVTGVFLGREPILGRPTTGKWTHFAVGLHRVWSDPVKSAGHRMAELREEFASVSRALKEYTPSTVQAAINLLKSGTLYRAERVLPTAEWFQSLQRALDGAPNRANRIWLAIANAPQGFTHLRGSVLGTLFADITTGFDAAQIAKRFNEKMDPANYHRAKSVPRQGQVEAAEKAVQALGVTPAFQRRYATDADLLNKAPPGAYLWLPGEVQASAKPKAAGEPGVFDHLKPQEPALPELDIPPKLMTWARFAKDVLPGAARLQYRTPRLGRFAALTAPADPSAPHILQWDNDVSWSFTAGATSAQQWNLKAGELVDVRAVVRTPNRWSGDERFAHQGNGAFLLLEGAKDTRNFPGGGMFVEHLRNDLKPYRAVIQAHMNALIVQGADAPGAAFGVGLLEGNDWTEVGEPLPVKAMPPGKPGTVPKRVHVILVIDDSGSMRSYLGAAREALQSLVIGVRAMPGEVDVTLIRFGDRVHVQHNAMPLALLGDPTTMLNGSSGSTSLNDAIGEAIRLGASRATAHLTDTSFFLGIVTDGEENHSTKFTIPHVREMVMNVQATNRWTIAYAGAGANPKHYARQIGILEGNMTGFEASDEGFRGLRDQYTISTRSLSQSYASGQTMSSSFFSSASGQRAIGTDLPTLVATMKNGTNLAAKLDRWE